DLYFRGLGKASYGYSMGECGLVITNKILDIRPAGYRPVFKVTLDNGASVRVTNNHKFPVGDQELRTDELEVGFQLRFLTEDKSQYYGERIVSIEPDGECETYNVEMDAPYHTLAVNDGIIACNSHAVAYAY